MPLGFDRTAAKPSSELCSRKQTSRHHACTDMPARTPEVLTAVRASSSAARHSSNHPIICLCHVLLYVNSNPGRALHRPERRLKTSHAATPTAIAQASRFTPGYIPTTHLKQPMARNKMRIMCTAAAMLLLALPRQHVPLLRGCSSVSLCRPGCSSMPFCRPGCSSMPLSRPGCSSIRAIKPHSGTTKCISYIIAYANKPEPQEPPSTTSKARFDQR